MSSKVFTFTNTNPVNEPAYPSDYNDVGGIGVTEKANPGAETGPYGNGLKDNAVALPVPQSNIQLILEAGESISLEATNELAVAFYEEYMKDAKGVSVVESDKDYSIIYYSAKVLMPTGYDNPVGFYDDPVRLTNLTPTFGEYDETYTTSYEYPTEELDGGYFIVKVAEGTPAYVASHTAPYVSNVKFYKKVDDEYVDAEIADQAGYEGFDGDLYVHATACEFIADQFFVAAGDCSEAMKDWVEAMTTLANGFIVETSDTPTCEIEVTEANLESVTDKIATVAYVSLVGATLETTV